MATRLLSIALVTETYAPEVNGVAMTLGRLTAGMTSRGHRVRIVRPRQLGETSGPAENGQLLTPGLPIPGYPELRFGLPAGNHLWQTWRAELPDIVHIATEGPLGHSALSAARRLGIPVVSTFHTNFHVYSKHYGVGWLRGSIERYLRWFHNRTATTLVPTPALAHELGQRGFRDVGVLSRGVDTRLFNPGRRSDALRMQWGAGPDDLVAIVVSRLAPEKNLDLALRAFAALREKLPTARMVCVGDGPVRAALERRYPDCLFAGTRLGEDLAAHYASADLFLFPSMTETYGNVVSEALASGLPVVAFDHAAASSLVKNGINGQRVTPGDAQAFVMAVSELARHPDLLSAMRTAAPDSVRHLDWERIHGGYEALLHQVIDRHARAQAHTEQIRFAPD
jgi:glycosyltransferase involved in cell wall biosynthesis